MMNWLQRAAWTCGLAWAALALLAGGAQAQDGAVIKRATHLRDTPSDSGASVAPLEAGATVTRSSERRGAWTRVATPQGASGWVHMFDLGPQTGAAAGGSSSGGNAATSGLRGLGGLLGGGSAPTTTATSTVGIRGLGAEDIANATPNPAAVGQAEGLRASADQARQFASSAALRQREVPALAKPALPSGGSASGGGGRSGNPSDPNYSPN